MSSKMYLACSKTQQIGEELPDHIYPKNYEGSSKAIEVDAALHLYRGIFKNSSKQLNMSAIVADETSTIRALLRYTSKVNKRERVYTEITEPEWRVNLSHKTKAVAKPIFNLATSRKSINLFIKIDTVRCKKILWVHAQG